MKLKRMYGGFIFFVSVLCLQSIFPSDSAAQIRQGVWYCIEGSYRDTMLTDFDATFNVKNATDYEASFDWNYDEGLARTTYQISASGDTLFTRLSDFIHTGSRGWSTSGGDTIFYYNLSNCSEAAWIKAGQTAVAWGFPEGATKSRILFSTEGDSILVLKSVDGNTVLTYTYGAKRPLHNRVRFRVNMAVQKQLGNFNPAAGNKVVLRGNFNQWMGNATELTNVTSTDIYETTVDFAPGMVATTQLYKFFIIKNGGEEQPESDPARSFTVEPYSQDLGIAWFDRRARLDEVQAIAITENGLEDYTPTAAYNSQFDEFLVVWLMNDAGLFGRIIKSDGTPAGPAFPVSLYNTAQRNPQVAYNTIENEYLVVWQDYRRGNWDIQGLRLDHEGKKLKSPNSDADSTFAVCSNDSLQSEPAVSYNYLDNCYLVVWEDRRNTKSYQGMDSYNIDIYGQRVASDGVLLTPMDPPDPKVNFRIAFIAYYDELLPDVAYCGIADKEVNEWLVVFKRQEMGGYGGSRIWGVRIKGNSGSRLNTWGYEVPYPAAAKANAGPGSWGPPWLPEFPIGWDDSDFWGMKDFDQCSPHVESNDDPFPTMLDKANAERYPVPEFLVSWSDGRRQGDDIFCQRVAYFPDTTAYRMGLKDTFGVDSLFTVVPLNRNGDWAEESADWITWPNAPVTTDPFEQTWNQIDYDSDNGVFLVTWNDWRSAAWNGVDYDGFPPESDIYGQRLWINPQDSTLVWIDHDGTWNVDPALNTPIAFTTASEGNMMYPAVAFGEANTDFLVAYEYTEDNISVDIVANLYEGTPPIRTDVETNRRGSPRAFELSQNFPNPFNPETRIRFNLPDAGHVLLCVYDLLGRETATVVDGVMSEGFHDTVWNGRLTDGTPASSGVYICRLTWTKGSDTRIRNTKMVLVR